MYTPLYCFLLTNWWPVLKITLCKPLHIFGTLFRWYYTTFLCANAIQVLCKGIFIASEWTLSKNCSTLLCMTVTKGSFLTYFSSLCKWTLHLTAFRSFSDPVFAPTLFKLAFKRKTCLFHLGSCHTIFQFSNSLNYFWFYKFYRVPYWLLCDLDKLKVLILFIVKYILIPSKRKYVSS